MRRRNKLLLAIGLSVATVIASGQYMDRSQTRPVVGAAAQTAMSGAELDRVMSMTLSGVTPLAARLPGPTSVTLASLPPLPEDPAVDGLSRAPQHRIAGISGPAGRIADGVGLDMPDFGVSGLPCDPALTAEATPVATVRLTLSTPCQPGRRVTVHHDHISFSDRTDQMGLLNVEVPAMTASAAFVAELEDGTRVTRTVLVPSALRSASVALVTDSAAGMALHAYEDGARFGEPGHVWSGAPRGQGARGTVRVLGDPALPGGRIAQIYTAPETAPEVRLAVEAEVTAANCGRAIEAQTLLPDRTGRPRAGTLSFVLPGCEAMGEFLVLKNLSPDRKLASN